MTLPSSPESLFFLFGYESVREKCARCGSRGAVPLGHQRARKNQGPQACHWPPPPEAEWWRWHTYQKITSFS